jgi:outer membrane protein
MHDAAGGTLVKIRLHLVITIVLGVLAFAAAAGAQGASPPPAPPGTQLTLDQAMQYAVDHYPTVRAALEQVNVSTAGVSVARAAYLPRLDSLWQSNLATVNNIFGQVLPQSILPALSGPVLPSASGQGVWSSATGALASWEPLDFGLRSASVAGAEATVTRARASEALTRLDVQGAVGAAFLNIVAAQRAVAAAQADVDRRDVLGRAVRALVDNQLRPGADLSRADAERAAAGTRLIQAQQTLMLAQTTLARVLGDTSGAIAIDAGALSDQLPPSDVPAVAATAHPLVQVRQAAIGVAQAQQQVLARTDYPRVYLQSSVFGRGSGADPDGQLDSGPGGLGLERVNWAAGVQVVFPNVFDFSSLRARKAAAAATTRAETALMDEAVLSVTSQQQATAVMLQGARAIAANMPVQLAAAQQSEAQARARYDAGLATLNEIADAQSLLAQAEMQDQLARVDVWRALLAAALARGSVAPFVTLIRP